MTDAESGFSADERAAMKQRAEELRSTKGLKGAAKMAREVEACAQAISELEGVDLEVAVALNAIVADVAPDLQPKTFYGFPAYARDGKVVVFYQPASKFKTRYGTVSFDESANLDDGPMWGVSFAVVEVTPAVKDRIRDLVKQAVS